jgi:hypothetical protein
MLLQPMMQTITFFTNDDIKLVEVDWEEDSDEEKQEDDCKDEKLKFKVLSSYNRHFAYVSECPCYQLQQPLYDFDLEIPIPPPEQV